MVTLNQLRTFLAVADNGSVRAAAAELVVTVRAVEATLTRAYAKLGVRSRTELAARLHRGG